MIKHKWPTRNNLHFKNKSNTFCNHFLIKDAFSFCTKGKASFIFFLDRVTFHCTAPGCKKSQDLISENIDVMLMNIRTESGVYISVFQSVCCGTLVCCESSSSMLCFSVSSTGNWSTKHSEPSALSSSKQAQKVETWLF